MKYYKDTAGNVYAYSDIQTPAENLIELTPEEMQLRGRVGRGAEQSYCLLISSFKISNESRKRLATMVRTNDGFEIAEMDMKLRGPGDLEGTRQSGIGFDLKIANLGKDGEILQLARDVATDILSKDPFLQQEENRVLLENLKSKQTDFDWSSIS